MLKKLISTWTKGPDFWPVPTLSSATAMVWPYHVSKKKAPWWWWCCVSNHSGTAYCAQLLNMTIHHRISAITFKEAPFSTPPWFNPLGNAFGMLMRRGGSDVSIFFFFGRFFKFIMMSFLKLSKNLTDKTTLFLWKLLYAWKIVFL